MPNPVGLYESVFHSLEDQIALLDQAGNILAVNLAWQVFGAENGLPSGYSWVNQSDIEALSGSAAAGDSLAGDALQGIMGVLAGKHASFHYEYPCHS